MKRYIVTLALICLLVLTGAGFSCNKQANNNQTNGTLTAEQVQQRAQNIKTVADYLTEAGKVKRQLHSEGLTTPQQDAGITRALLKANESYSDYIKSEKMRLANNPNALPDSNKVMALHVALQALKNPVNFGITDANVTTIWLALAPVLDTLLSRIQ